MGIKENRPNITILRRIVGETSRLLGHSGGRSELDPPQKSGGFSGMREIIARGGRRRIFDDGERSRRPMRDVFHLVKAYKITGVNLSPGGFGRHRQIRPSVDSVHKFTRWKREYSKASSGIHRPPDAQYSGAEPPHIPIALYYGVATNLRPVSRKPRSAQPSLPNVRTRIPSPSTTQRPGRDAGKGASKMAPLGSRDPKSPLFHPTAHGVRDLMR